MAITNPVLISRPSTGRAPLLLGQRHHVQQRVADRFAAVLADNDVRVAVIDNPEQFKNPIFGEVHDLGEGEHVHLIFRGSEEIRPIPGAYNVAWFAWGFDALKSGGPADELILTDQVRMLRACQEVWVGSTHAQAVLKRHGINQVYVVPAPIAVPETLPADRHAMLGGLSLIEAVPLVTSTAADRPAFTQLAARYVQRLGAHPPLKRALASGEIFLTVADAGDARKNLASAIEGFLMATTDRDDAVLLVKLVNWGAMESPATYLYHQVRALFGHPHALHEDRVIFFAGALGDEEMAQLYSTADFFLSASLGEGQNLSLLEAMAHGCVPVSVRNSAMNDYIDDSDAVVVAEGRYPGLFPQVSPELAQLRLESSFADRYQVADAVTRALALDGPARTALAQSARERVVARYAPDKVFATLAARLTVVNPNFAAANRVAAQAPILPEGATGKKWWR